LRMLLLLAVVAYSALVVLALLSDRIIFQPHPSSYRLSDLAASRGVQPIILTSGQVNISAVYLPNVSARYTLLFSHGNAEDLGDDLPLLNELRSAGFAVFAYDYRGYGTSPGISSEKSLYEDVDAAYEYVRRTLHVSPDRIISFGRSLGCAAAIHLAATHSVAGLIVEAPFLSAFRVLTHVRLLPWEKFDNAAIIRRVHSPVLVIHGRSDRVVPWWHGEQIYELANEPKRYLWVDRAGHNDVLPFASQRYFEALNDFVGLLDHNQQALQ
jgi:pimeloyl-ACP methyl ester carboxylesterase